MWQKPPLGVQLNAGHPLAHGLVGYWSMQEGSGRFIQDTSGNGNTGIFNGVIDRPSWVPARAGSALSFDSGSIGWVALDSRVTFPGSFSISCWIYVEAWDAAWRAIVAHGTTGTLPKIMQNINGTHMYIRVITTTDSTVVLPSAGVWHNIVLTRDDMGKCDFYVDAGVPNRLFVDAAQSGDSLWGNIGSSHSTTFPWNGLIDNVGFWDRALSASEIAQLYRDPFAMFQSEPIELWVASSPVTAPPTLSRRKVFGGLADRSPLLGGLVA